MDVSHVRRHRPKRNSPPAILLRESVREGKRIRKRTLVNLSSWAPARVEALRRALGAATDGERGAGFEAFRSGTKCF